jgi:alkylation response protein AidB-like acyl-CoA dehydrogenase
MTIHPGVGHLPQFAHLARLEHELGSPESGDHPFTFDRALADDEQERMPAEALDRLRELGWHRYCVPAELGGELRWCEQFIMQARSLARRDLTVAISQSTQLWSVLVWLGGTDAQRRGLADAALRGEVIPCLAYSESAHGADLMANDLEAAGDGDGYVLTGRKWPINRGVTSTHAVLLARTSPGRTGRSQSLFLVEKAHLDADRVLDLPRVPTHGLRGCDISGIGFDGARIPAEARIGDEGEGLELALRGLFITRTFCGALSLGAADTMLRVVTRFLRGRDLYDRPATDIPQVRETLANAYLSILIAECVGLVAARGLHLFPREASTWSSLAKVQSTRLVDDGARSLARALGARHYMRAEGEQGIFQKMLRDSAVVSLFDGSEPVCLDSLAAQLGLMARARRRPRQEDWAALYDLRVELEEFRPERVAVFGRGADAVFASLPALAEHLAGLAADDSSETGRLARLRTAVGALRLEVEDLFAQVEDTRESVGDEGKAADPDGARSIKGTPVRLVQLAMLCCVLHAKVACVGLWLHNREHLGDYFAEGGWLEAALHRPTGGRPDVGSLTPAFTEQLYARLVDQLEESAYFSHLPLAQAVAPPAA